MSSVVGSTPPQQRNPVSPQAEASSPGHVLLKFWPPRWLQVRFGRPDMRIVHNSATSRQAGLPPAERKAGSEDLCHKRIRSNTGQDYDVGCGNASGVTHPRGSCRIQTVDFLVPL